MTLPNPPDDDNEGDDNQMELLLMRHSSPFNTEGGATTSSLLLTERNSSPSTLRFTRPRSNPRNRTPMRYQSPLHDDPFRIPEDGPGPPGIGHGGITIRPSAGRAVGTALGARAAVRHVSCIDCQHTAAPLVFARNILIHADKIYMYIRRPWLKMHILEHQP